MGSEMWEVPEMVWVAVGLGLWQTTNGLYNIRADDPVDPKFYIPFSRDKNKIVELWPCRSFEEALVDCKKDFRKRLKKLGMRFVGSEKTSAGTPAPPVPAPSAGVASST